jgi:iron(II)-dependent oxidoreductase
MPHDYETPQILHDAPLRRDDQHHFHFDEFAVTLCRLIADKRTRTPLAIGVSGSWGSGKTTLLQRVRQMLSATVDLADATKPALLKFANEKDRPQEIFRVCRTVWFDAWKYTGEDHLLAALLRVIVIEMQASGFWQRLQAELNGPKKAELQWLDALIQPLTKFVSGGTYELKLKDVRTDTPLKSAAAFFDYFDDSLSRLLASWVGGKIVGGQEIDEQQGVMVIFVDDLDRCLPEKTVQVLEAIKLFLDKHGCVFVLGADLNVVRSAVETHYHNTKITGETASDYLEKIIQLRFELPPIVDTQMNDYLQAEAKEALDAETRQNWRLVMIGAEINPRKVKTFFNDLNLQWAMLKNIGQAEDVNRDDFTRWQVLMRVAPDNFREVVYGFPDDAIDLRHKFILDALKWAQGETSLDATFQDYAKSQRLRRVLREIKAFGQTFDPKTLDAFVHLTAPPPPPAPTPVEAKPAVVPPLAVEVKEEVVAAERIEVREPLRGAEKAPAANVQTWGGVDFVRIPAGKFLMGSKVDNQSALDSEKPQHTVEIPYDYWMARYPVTNDQFAKFVEATQYVTTAEKEGGWSTNDNKFVKGVDWRHALEPKKELKSKGDHPVVQVSWFDAMEYCKWLNQVLHSSEGIPMSSLAAHWDAWSADFQTRLPTEAEWEKAARGEYGNEWPWGNEFDKNKCNSSEGGKGGTTSVNSYSPQGDSPYGVADMVGNVWEWCHSLYKPYPYQVDDGREDRSALGGRVLRGGSFGNFQRGARCASRDDFSPDDRFDNFGFRVVVSPGLG